MDMKQVILSLTFLLTATLAHAQLTLDECQRQAQVNYPLVRRHVSMTFPMPERDICPGSLCRARLRIKVI